MLRQSKINISWLETLEERNSIQERSIENITPSLKKYIEEIGLSATLQAYIVENFVSQKTGICESLIREVHSFIFDGPPEFRGVYRTLEVKGGEYDFLHFYEIPKEMERICLIPLKTRGEIYAFLIEALGRIHPFIDGNRRTFFIITNLLLIRSGYSPIDWEIKRTLWEESKTINSRARLQFLLEYLS